MLNDMNIKAETRWHATPLLKLSVLVHLGTVLFVLVCPEKWIDGLLMIIVNHALLAASGLWPKCNLLGPNIARLCGDRAELALTIDDGPDPEVTPLVMAILAEKNVKATFFCIAEKVARYPELAKSMSAAGHRIENHSMYHRHTFSMMGWGGIKRELLLAQQTISAVSGTTPRFFRAPAGLRNPFLDPLLHQQGLQLVSWSRRGFDTRSKNGKKILERLLKNLKAGDILLLHDGNAARSKHGQPVVLEVLPLLIDEAERRGFNFVTVEDGLRG